jgi:lipopolysaccharide export system protein LptC
MTVAARLAVGLFLAAAACSQSRQSEAKQLAPEFNLEGVRFRVWRGAELRARGEARQVTILRDTTETSAMDLRAEMPRAGGNVTITAPAGEGVLNSSTFTAHGGVVLTRGDARATTDRATYTPAPDGSSARITGREPVEVVRPGFRLDGIGFSYDLATDVLDLGEPVEARFARSGGAR